MYTGKTGWGGRGSLPLSQALLSERLEQASQEGVFQQMKNQTPGLGCHGPFSKIHLGYLTIIPRAQMGSESIAHEAEGRMGYW